VERKTNKQKKLRDNNIIKIDFSGSKVTADNQSTAYYSRFS
jgi:hypothetical protein